ncbi:uncharacterized protein LOC142823205 [Pelodiscus sinensis]|uniref:uncharacterized protein LOC142823205 n=1 Tax=Pelodiscus sinensis TaxID=13735 RepID=UPI003F6CACDC
MVRGGHGRPPLGATPMILLVLYLLLLGSLSNCVPCRKEPELEPLPAGVDPYMQPVGILQPQIRPPGQGTGSKPGAYGGTGSGLHAHPGPGSYGIDGPGAYRGTGNGISGGTWSGSSEGTWSGSSGGTGNGISGGTWSGSSEGTWSGSSGGTGNGISGGTWSGSSGGTGNGISGGTWSGSSGETGNGISGGTWSGSSGGTGNGISGGTWSGSSGGALPEPYRPPGPGSYEIGAPGASGGTWSGSSGGTWSGSSGRDLDRPYGQLEPGSYGIDGPGASGGSGDGTFGGPGTGSSRGTGCMLNQGASGGSDLQLRRKRKGPVGSQPVVSVGDYPVQAGEPGAGSGTVVARPFERVPPVYKRPGLPFVPGLRDNARLAGHVRIRYEDAGSPRGKSQPGLMAGKIPRPQYKEPGIPYIPSHAELPCHAGQRVTSKPQVSTEGSEGGGIGGGGGAVTQEVTSQNSSTPMLPSVPASTGSVVGAGGV